MFTYYNILCALMCLSAEYIYIFSLSLSISLSDPLSLSINLSALSYSILYAQILYLWTLYIFFLFMFYILKRRTENVMNYDYCPLNAANATITQIYRSIFEEYFEFKI